MTYEFTESRTVLIGLLIPLILQLFIANHPLYYSFVMLCLLIVFFGFLERFELAIKGNQLIYVLKIGNTQIYKRVVSEKEIGAIQFKRVGWKYKCAAIKTVKGLNIRITNFKPDSVYITLEEFANKHEIPVQKTKDYTILER